MQEERDALKEQKISRFRAGRMAVRDAVEFPDEVIRNAVEVRHTVIGKLVIATDIPL